MLRPLIAAMALVCVMAGTAFAHPNYPGLESHRDSIEVSGRVGAGKARKPASESRTGRNAVAIARRYVGRNPTGWKRLWCAVFANLVEKKAGRPGTGSAMAKSFATYGKPVPKKAAKPGDIVVLARRGGGHVGYAVEPPKGGKIKLISGNTGGRKGRRIVAEGYYPMARVIAVRRPS